MKDVITIDLTGSPGTPAMSEGQGQSCPESETGITETAQFRNAEIVGASSEEVIASSPKNVKAKDNLFKAWKDINNLFEEKDKMIENLEEEIALLKSNMDVVKKDVAELKEAQRLNEQWRIEEGGKMKSFESELIIMKRKLVNEEVEKQIEMHQQHKSGVKEDDTPKKDVVRLGSESKVKVSHHLHEKIVTEGNASAKPKPTSGETRKHPERELEFEKDEASRQVKFQNRSPDMTPASSSESVQEYRLRWNNHHSNMRLIFDYLCQSKPSTDATLACEDRSLKCHKVVLVACSSLFRSLFNENRCSHPVVILKDFKLSEITGIIEYMYRGEVTIPQDQLPGFLKLAQMLKVKGFVEDEDNLSESGSSSSSSFQESFTDETTSFQNQSRELSPSPSLKRKIFHDNTQSEPGPQKKRKTFVETSKDMSSLLPAVFGQASDRNNAPEQSPQTSLPQRMLFNDYVSVVNTTHGSVQQNTRGDDNNNNSKDNQGPIPAYFLAAHQPETKKYRQYSRDAVMSAIDDVRQGMTPLMAARKFGIPSRTLYDKVKRLGIVLPEHRPKRQGNVPMSVSYCEGQLMKGNGTDIFIPKEQSSNLPGGNGNGEDRSAGREIK